MQVRADFAATVGNTPLIRLNRLSDETGCEILGKAEFMNPGRLGEGTGPRCGSSASTRRAVLWYPAAPVVEGTAGNTGIGLAHICNARGYRASSTCQTTNPKRK